MTHPHPHPHLHHHDHHHDAPGEIPVLDIGGDIGAVLVYLDGPTPSGELHARPLGEPARQFHTGVHPRQLSGHRVYVALYPEVVAGTYEILDDEREPLATIGVVGGEVSELDLRVSALSAR